MLVKNPVAYLQSVGEDITKDPIEAFIEHDVRLIQRLQDRVPMDPEWDTSMYVVITHEPCTSDSGSTTYAEFTTHWRIMVEDFEGEKIDLPIDDEDARTAVDAIRAYLDNLN